MAVAARLIAWCRPRSRMLLTAGLVLLLVASWAPFQLEPPRLHTNQAELAADGTLRLSPPSLVRTDEPPGWLDEVIAAGAFTLHVEARSAAPRQDGPARIVSVSSDITIRNLTVGQLGTGLAVRLRHPGTDQQGQPQIVVPGVFATPAWRTIVLDVGDRVTIDVDGTPVYDRPLDPDPLAGWDPSFPLLFGDERTGNRPWAGEVRAARLTVDGRTHDLLANDDLRLPDRFWDLPGRLTEGRSGVSPASLVIWLLHVVAGAALAGLLALRRPGASLASTFGWWALVSVVANAGKIVVATRHPSVATVLLQLSGGLLGIALVLAVTTVRPEETVLAGPEAPTDP